MRVHKIGLQSAEEQGCLGQTETPVCALFNRLPDISTGEHIQPESKAIVMHYTTVWTRCLSTGILILTVILPCQSCHSQSGLGRNRMLTVEQTYGLVFVTDTEGEDPDLVSLANPEAKAGLIQIAKNIEDPALCGGAICILGNICSNEEANFLLELADSRFHGNLTKPYLRAFIGLQAGLWRMGVRGSVDAKRILRMMTTYEFWESRFPQVRGNNIDISSSDICELRIFAMITYAAMNPNDWKKVAADLRGSLPQPDQSQNPDFGVFYASRLEDKVIERTVHAQRSEWLKSQIRPVPPSILDFISTAFNGDFENPGRQGHTVDRVAQSPGQEVRMPSHRGPNSIEVKAEPEEKTRLKIAIASAQAAFKQFRTTLKNGEYSPLATRIIDKETHQPLKEKDQRTDAVIQAFDQTRRVLDTVEADFKATQFEVTTQVHQASPKLPAAGEEPFVDQRSITVKWTIPGSAAAVQRRAPEIPLNVTTRSKEGDMIVVMKWINGEWYWLPLGW